MSNITIEVDADPVSVEIVESVVTVADIPFTPVTVEIDASPTEVSIEGHDLTVEITNTVTTVEDTRQPVTVEIVNGTVSFPNGLTIDDVAWTVLDLTSSVTDIFGTPVSLGTGAYLTMRYTRIGRYVRGGLVGKVTADHTITPPGGPAPVTPSGHLVIPESALPYAPYLLPGGLAHASNFGYLGIPESEPGWSGPDNGGGVAHTHAVAGHTTYDTFGVPADVPTTGPVPATDIHTHNITSYGGFGPSWTLAPADSGPLGNLAHSHTRSNDGYIITIGPIFSDLLGGGTVSLTFVHFNAATSNGGLDNLFNITGRGWDGVTQYTPDLTAPIVREFSINTAFEYEAATAL